MSGAFDAIVIGAGHNGLSAAAELAGQGKRVCVLERGDGPGGMAAEGIAHLVYNLSPKVARDLGLDLRALPTVSLCPEGRHAVMTGDDLRYADGGDHPEAAVFADLHARLVRFAALLAPLGDMPPPALAAGLGEMGVLGKLGLSLKRMGKAEMREFLRIVLSNVFDLVLDDLADGPVAGGLAADAVRGAFAGPRSPGSVFSLMYRMGQGGGASLPMGGIGAVTRAMEDRARGAGVELRCGVGVASVTVEDDRVTGVTLEDGAVLDTGLVLSSLAAPQSMALVGPAEYDVETVRALRTLRAKPSVAKLNLTLSDVPAIAGLTDAQRAGRLLLAPSATYVEDAFNPVKYGEASPHPVLEAVMPSLTDPSLDPVLSINVQYVPTGAARDAVQDSVVAALEPYMPTLPGLIAGAEMLLPEDIAARTGAAHWHHADMSFDQILTVRPVGGMARYGFGPAGYYLCGASAHPGGDITGQPGRNAARAALKGGAA